MDSSTCETIKIKGSIKGYSKPVFINAEIYPYIVSTKAYNDVLIIPKTTDLTILPSKAIAICSDGITRDRNISWITKDLDFAKVGNCIVKSNPIQDDNELTSIQAVCNVSIVSEETSLAQSNIPTLVMIPKSSKVTLGDLPKQLTIPYGGNILKDQPAIWNTENVKIDVIGDYVARATIKVDTYNIVQLATKVSIIGAAQLVNRMVIQNQFSSTPKAATALNN